MATQRKPLVSIACGGTGGHFFPGVAVARELQNQGARTSLWISSKKIDQQSAQTVPDLKCRELTAVGFEWLQPWKFVYAMRSAMRSVHAQMLQDCPQAVLGMGGFTAAAPVVQGKKLGALTFLHESNAKAGRANRLLSRWADEVFVGLSQATGYFDVKSTLNVGTPVRQSFRCAEYRFSRQVLGFEMDKPLILVLGGSQGARGVNNLLMKTMHRLPEVQVLHLSGANDLDEVRKSYASRKCPSQVHAFLTEMPEAMAAATLAITRSGASSLAELAAAGVPSIMMPLPSSADNHQLANARAVAEIGGGIIVEEKMSSGQMGSIISTLLNDKAKLNTMSKNIRKLDRPDAAKRIAARILERM
tara:strand:+ start:1022 stop:2101 length:1080 start_codon:yes stop_codon:yes gene_type:complete